MDIELDLEEIKTIDDLNEALDEIQSEELEVQLKNKLIRQLNSHALNSDIDTLEVMNFSKKTNDTIWKNRENKNSESETENKKITIDEAKTLNDFIDLSQDLSSGTLEERQALLKEIRSKAIKELDVHDLLSFKKDLDLIVEEHRAEKHGNDVNLEKTTNTLQSMLSKKVSEPSHSNENSISQKKDKKKFIKQ